MRNRSLPIMVSKGDGQTSRSAAKPGGMRSGSWSLHDAASGVRMTSSISRSATTSTRAAGAPGSAPPGGAGLSGLAEHADEHHAGPGMPANRVGDQGRRRPRPDDQRAPLRSGKDTIQRGAPGGEQRAVEDDVQDQDRAGKRVGLAQEVDRGERQQLDQEGRREQARERLPEALLVAVEPEEPEAQRLHRGHHHDVSGREAHAAGGQERLGPRNRDVSPQVERGVERNHGDRHVAHRGDGRKRRPPAGEQGAPAHERAVRVQTGRLYPSRPAARPEARAALSTAK